ncbi:putative hydrolase [Flavobacterium cauense R2A-7]|uniref:Pimeloyl-ACP methyl ester carboxylesterase n=1 Tax=Flavobacterium cauense R2A-7 TaxID=1341154 RepID=V6RVZ1_9FLAO|nr:alpha/beta hydrolase [Flavobacterium cauense]ESU18651.1 putative hydrolase [Flavobacterium cauense R2A-7]KGO81867.1 alpha/beta hydrolase [Flavobacterium cauense R2A-7]TWI13903.1 pimeloyl-ACP methyl ester carboxylesterase [Flavobacterium cauense R2A-7]
MKKPKHQQTIKIPKGILFTAKALEIISPKLATKFAIKLFTTPIRHKLPKREIEMDVKSKQQLVKIEAINKEIMLYQYGSGEKKVLLVHGWSGRGTQLVKIADELLKLSYSTISFDAPGHGKSPGKTSNMTEFIAAAMEIEKQFGPFEFAIGHSLGGMTVMNAIKKGLNVKKAVIIGSGDVVQDIMDDFVLKLGLKTEISKLMRIAFENKLGETMNSYSAYIAAKEVSIPVLIIHDENDDDVPVTAGQHIHQHLKNGQIMITKELGHRKILGDSKVIQRIVEFIR